MKLTKTLFGACAVLLLLSFAVGTVSAQDLSKEKQDKMLRINEIDNKLKASPSKDEYDALLKERQRLADEIKEIDKKLMEDVEAMKRINAVKKAYNDGNTALRLGQYQQAIEHYNKALSMDPTFYKAYYGKGYALNRTRQYNEAVVAYERAVEHNPFYTDAYIALGNIYESRLGNPDKAISVFRTAIKNDSASHKAYYELGAVYLNIKKDYEKAADYFTKATQIKPNYDLAFFSLGVSLTELGKYSQAVLAFENALAFSSRKRWDDPHARLAVVYNKQGNCSGALAAAEEALSISKNNGLALYEAGKASKCLGQESQALSYFETLKRDRVWKKTAEYEIDLIVNKHKYGGND